MTWFWSRARLVINKKQKYFSSRATNLLKTWFLFLIYKKGQKEDKNEFVTKSVGIIVTIILYFKNISLIASKTFATQCFFTDHLNQETLNKTTCRTLSRNLRQLWQNSMKSFRTVMIIFWGFQDFLVYVAKHFFCRFRILLTWLFSNVL